MQESKPSETAVPNPFPLPITTKALPAPTPPHETHKKRKADVHKLRPTISVATTSLTCRPASPTRPPVSPVTPPLAPAQIVPPPAEPIVFEENPDVLALQSAISILQMQRARAKADMVALRQIRDEAVARPEVFLRDLERGKVGKRGDGLFFGGVGGEAGGISEGESEGNSESDTTGDTAGETEGSEDVDAMEVKADSRSGGGRSAGADPDGADDVELVEAFPGEAEPSGSASPLNLKDKGKGKAISTARPTPSPRRKSNPRPWRSIPQPQNIVRMPPINWAKYGVIGESLDKLHAEQKAAPTSGQPVQLGLGGTYPYRFGDPEVAPGAGGTEGTSQRFLGIAAPYAPLRDRVDKRKKGGM